MSLTIKIPFAFPVFFLLLSYLPIDHHRLQRLPIAAGPCFAHHLHSILFFFSNLFFLLFVGIAEFAFGFCGSVLLVVDPQSSPVDNAASRFASCRDGHSYNGCEGHCPATTG